MRRLRVSGYRVKPCKSQGPATKCVRAQAWTICFWLWAVWASLHAWGFAPRDSTTGWLRQPVEAVKELLFQPAICRMPVMYWRRLHTGMREGWEEVCARHSCVWRVALERAP